MNNCDEKIYINIGAMYYDFNSYEKSIDAVIEFIQKDQLDENQSLEFLEKAATYFHVFVSFNFWTLFDSA